MFSKTERHIYSHMAFGKDRTDMLTTGAEKAAFAALDAAVVNCRDRDLRRNPDVLQALKTLRELGLCEKRIRRFHQALDDETPVGRVYRAKAALRAMKELRGYLSSAGAGF